MLVRPARWNHSQRSTIYPGPVPWMKPPGNYNRRQNSSLGYLCNVTNYLYFTTEVWNLLKKHCCPPSFPTQYNVENQVKLKVLVLNIVWGVGARLCRWGCIRIWRDWAKAPKVHDCSWLFIYCQQFGGFTVTFLPISDIGDVLFLHYSCQETWLPISDNQCGRVGEFSFSLLKFYRMI